MVIISTRAVEVSIQAVSPELRSENLARYGSVGAGAAGAAAAGAAVSPPPAAAAAAAAGASSAATGRHPKLNESPSTSTANAAASERARDELYLHNFKSMRMTCNSLFF